MDTKKRANPRPGPQGDCGRSERAVPKIRASKSGRWRALALLLVHALVAVHVAHWLATGSTMSPLEPSEAMEFSKHDLVNAGFVFFALTIASTLVLGRWFCGWACHVVALQDLSLWLLKRVGIRPKPLRSRLLAFVPSLAALYMFVYPMAYRLWSGEGLGRPHVALTREDFWATFPPWPVALATFAVCGGAVVYFLGAKGFCTYGCPYGAIYGLVDRFAVGRIRVTDACEGCGHCTATCTSNVLVHAEVRDHGMVVDPGCMKCMDCVSVCPKNALYFGFGKPAVATRAPAAQRTKAQATWGEEILLATFFLATFLIYRGLYGAIPFLLALGLASVLACCFGALVRMLRRKNASFLGRTLKQNGGWTRSGLVFALLMGGVTAFSAHSGFVQVHSERSTKAYESLLPRREAFLDDPRLQLEGEERRTAEEAVASAERVRRFGLVSTRRNEIQLAWLRLFAGSPESFEQGLRGLTAGGEENSALHFDLARYFEARGRTEEALSELEASLAARASASGFDRLARLRWGMGHQEEALVVFERALEAFPDNTDLRFNQAVVLAMLGRTEDGIGAFRKVLELDPGRIDALENLAGLLASTGALDEARILQERALTLRGQVSGNQ